MSTYSHQSNPHSRDPRLGVKTADKDYELDVPIFATGFDSYVGGFLNIDLRDLNGETIQDHWKNGATTYLGLTIDQFPNLFFVYGPQGPTAFCNAPTCAELQGGWILATIAYLQKHGITKFAPTTNAALKFKKAWKICVIPGCFRYGRD